MWSICTYGAFICKFIFQAKATYILDINLYSLLPWTISKLSVTYHTSVWSKEQPQTPSLKCFRGLSLQQLNRCEGPIMIISVMEVCVTLNGACAYSAYSKNVINVWLACTSCFLPHDIYNTIHLLTLKSSHDYHHRFQKLWNHPNDF